MKISRFWPTTAVCVLSLCLSLGTTANDTGHPGGGTLSGLYYSLTGWLTSFSELSDCDLAAQINATQSTEIDLPEGWDWIPASSNDVDHKGIFVEPNKDFWVRVDYLPDMNLLSAQCLNKDENLQLYQERSRIARNELFELMGDKIDNRFKLQLGSLLYGAGCYRNIGIYMRAQVNPVKEWYQKTLKLNPNAFDAFTQGEHKYTYSALRLKEFVEMFVEHDDLDLVQSICVHLHNSRGMLPKINIFSTGNLYQDWKIYKSLQAPPEEVSDRKETRIIGVKDRGRENTRVKNSEPLDDQRRAFKEQGKDMQLARRQAALLEHTLFLSTPQQEHDRT